MTQDQMTNMTHYDREINFNQNPFKSIIRTKTRQGMYENNFCSAIHA